MTLLSYFRLYNLFCPWKSSKWAQRSNRRSHQEWPRIGFYILSDGHSKIRLRTPALCSLILSDALYFGIRISHRHSEPKLRIKFGNYWEKLMPCPFTGPKMFWADPSFLCQTNNFFTYRGSHKHFVPDKKMICIQ